MTIKTIGMAKSETGEVVINDPQPILSICVISSLDDWATKEEVFKKYLIKGEKVELIVLLNEQGEEESLVERQDNIYEYVYTGELDYAHLRNICKEFATGTWILTLDMDEVIPEIYHNSLLKLLYEHKNQLTQGFKLGIASSSYDTFTSQSVRENIESIRIFRNDKGYKYFGCVHELIDFTIPHQFVKNVSIQIVHLGYDLTQEELLNKFYQRYYQLLTLLKSLRPNEELYKSKYKHYSMYLKSTIDYITDHF